MSAGCCPPFALALSPLPEMNPLAVLHAPPVRAVAPVYFDPADALNLNDHPKTWNLSDGAVALLSRSAEWSARFPTYGSVPTDMLARFCSDPVQAAEELCRRGLWRRAKGGYQFTDWAQFGETAEQKAERDAAAEVKREYDAERQRKSRANRRSVHSGKIRAALPVTTDVAGMSHVTACDASSDRSDQDQSIRGGQSRSQSDAQARESPELVTAVADAICAKVGYIPTEDQALAVIAAIRERARKAKRRIRIPMKYIPQAVENEPDIYAGLLDGDPPPLAALTAAEPPPDREGERHEYEHDPATGVCLCEYPKYSWRHDIIAETG